MKKILLLGVSAAMLVSSTAAPLHPNQIQVRNGNEAISEARLKAAAVAPGSRAAAPGVTLRVSGNKGLSMKSVSPAIGLSKITPVAKVPVSKAPVHQASASGVLPEGVSFQESFEGWDGESLPWYPEGWTLDSKTGKTGVESTTWGPCGAQVFLGIYPADGETMMSVTFDADNLEAFQDEWLVSPEITVSEFEQLKFHAYIDPFWLFSIDNLDWETYEYVGGREVTFTLKVLVKEENADWVEVWDATTPWMDVDALDMLSSTPAGLEEFTVPLGSFEGKKVQIAFQFVGKDSNVVFLDCVTVGLPQLDGISYEDPAETLYWGFDRSESWRSLTVSIAQYPVYAPLTWENMSYAEGATFQWEYCDPITADWVTSDDDNLTVTYLPDYSSEASTRNNWFYAPRLHASAPGATDATYQAPYNYFQAGGKPERMVNLETGETALLDFGLLPFNSDIHGMGFVAAEADFGQPATPIFGYDSNCDAYWLNDVMNGNIEDAAEGDHVYVDAIMNMLIPGSAPMVISGANLLAKGQIKEGVEFKLEIIPLDDSNVPMTDAPLASAICHYEDVLIQEGGMQNFLNIVFDFETPVVINPGDNNCMIRVSGFHDPEHVDYFAPMQSMLPFSHGNVIAWLDKLLKLDGATDYRRSYSPLFRYESEYGMCHNAFAINLAAYHPWLESTVSEIEVPSDGTPVEVLLDSYHDGASLTVDAPAGVTAKVSGRYGECKLVVSHNEADEIADGTLTVSGPGVKKVFAISETAGVDGVGADKAAGVVPVAAYTVTGQPVSIDNAASGVYVVKYSDGSAAKVSVR